MYAAETLIDEKALVLRLIDGDEDAFCELYAAYKGRLIYFAMRFLKSREHAEDVFQDAFTVIWQSDVSSIPMLPSLPTFIQLFATVC